MATAFSDSLWYSSVEENLAKQARDLMRSGDLDAAWEFVRATLETTEEGGRDSWPLRFIRAQLLELRGQAEEALRYLESLPSPADDDLVSRISLKMYRGSFSDSLGRWQSSHQLLTEAETMARDAGLRQLEGDVHLSRAYAFFRQKDYISSDLHFRHAHRIAGEVGGWYLRGYSLWGIGKTLMIQEKYKESMPWLQNALATFEAAAAQLAVATVWGELAVCYLGIGDDATALRLLTDAARIEHRAGYIHNYQVTLATIGNVYLHRRDYFQAISYYQQALTLARRIKDPVSIKKWTRNVNLAYARIRLAVDASRRR